MEEKNWNFSVPQYIVDEVNEYNKKSKMGKSKCMKLENIKALIGLAVLNNKITKEEGNCILGEIRKIGDNSEPIFLNP